MNQVHHSEVRADQRGVTEERKLSAIKTLAIVGFIGILILLLWLAVIVVRHIPEGFATLASLMESVSSPSRDLSLEVDDTVVNTSDELNISWTTTRREGVYGFTFECVPGVAATLVAEGQTIPLTCDSWSTLPEGADDAKISFTSDTARYTDVTLKIRFTPEEGATEVKTVLVTVVNESIDDSPEPEPEQPATTTPETPKPVTPKPTPKPKPVSTIRVPVTTTTYPVSNPNGYADLAVSFIGVGSYSHSSKTFTKKTSLDNDSEGALRFEVKNIGTKTSGLWSYEVELPTESDNTLRSTLQPQLRPQERATITILFENVRERTGNVTIEVEVSGGNDTRSTNNDFERTVRIEN